MPIPKTLKDLLTLPTAPFAESAVMRYLARTCARLPNVEVAFDLYGNLLAVYRHRPRRGRVALALVAHTDHPGFVVRERIDRRTVRAEFRGGVRPEYFPGARVRFWAARGWVRGEVAAPARARQVPDVAGSIGRPEDVRIRVPEPVAAGDLGMWDLPDPVLRGGRVYARGCDDIAGAAALLQMLQNLARRRAAGEIYVLFTRAEEVGFVGALGAVRAGTLPKHVPVVSIETSSVLPGVTQGAGPILRVGDRAAVFHPGLTAHLERVARELAERNKRFAYQRKLMDGGTCEAAPFLAYGYVAGGICVALGNYHNMDTQRKKIGPEYISLSDWQRMVQWFEALACDDRGYEDAADAALLRPRMEERWARYAELLAEALSGSAGTAPGRRRGPGPEAGVATGARPPGTRGGGDHGQLRATMRSRVSTRR